MSVASAELGEIPTVSVRFVAFSGLARTNLYVARVDNNLGNISGFFRGKRSVATA